MPYRRRKLFGSAAPVSASGGMGYHPVLRRWVHNPIHVAWRAFKGANIATNVGEGNFMTREYRQHPVVGLQTAKHKRVVKSRKVDIPTVSQRRVKDYENKILTTNKAMPYRRKKSTYKRKSRPRRRRTYRKKLPPLTLSRSKIVRFRAVFAGAITSTSGTLAGYALKANSLNDPGSTLTAILPTSVDQWAAQYQKYIVLGSKLVIRINNTSNTGAGVIGIHLADNSTLLNNTSSYKMLPRTTQCIMTTQKDYSVCKMTYSGKKFWKLTNIRDDSEQEAAFSTTPGDPTDVAYYHVYANDLVGTSTFSCDVQFELEYICLLTDPVQLADSSL